MLLNFLHYETHFAISSLHLKTPANRAFFTPQPVKRIAECTEVSKVGTATQRRLVVYCLRDLGIGEETRLDGVLQALRDPDPLVRVAAVTSLKTQPEVGKVGLDLILHLFLEDPDSRVQHVAAITLAKIGAPTDEIRTALRDAARGRDPRLRKAAAAALELLKKKRARATSQVDCLVNGPSVD